MRARPEGRVILFGATGYTGRLTAHEMARQGIDPLLVGRQPAALEELAAEVAAKSGRRVPEIALADVEDPGSLARLVQSTGDVLVSTVGPFLTLGDLAVSVATQAGAGYLDSAGEPGFIAKVFGEYGPQAIKSGAVLLPAFGYDYVPGALAATIAVRRTLTAGRPPARVDIGYFVEGEMKSSGGTRASAAGVFLSDSYRWTKGKLQVERPGTRWRSFELGAGKSADAVSIGGIENWTIPSLTPSIREVNVYLGWAGRLSRAAAMAGAVSTTASRVPGVGAVWGTVLRSLTGPGSTGGPTPEQRAQARTLAIAETFDADGGFQQRVRIEGPSPYDLTASLLSWGAGMLLHGAENSAGALGPGEAFGSEAFISGCMAIGLAEVHHNR